MGEVVQVGPGQWELVMKFDLDDVILTKRVQWDHQPTPDQVTLARSRIQDFRPHEAGDYTLVRRWPGSRWCASWPHLVFVKQVGGPPWRWPKVLVQRWSICVGWRMTAFWVTLKHRSTS